MEPANDASSNLKSSITEDKRMEKLFQEMKKFYTSEQIRDLLQRTPKTTFQEFANEVMSDKIFKDLTHLDRHEQKEKGDCEDCKKNVDPNFRCKEHGKQCTCGLKFEKFSTFRHHRKFNNNQNKTETPNQD